ncbi:MAG: hypothetical protein KDA28_03650, partial [Phycisphaerales bacterium]|nr:hypothetical protein [Phycisphaerales bacterium]
YICSGEITYVPQQGTPETYVVEFNITVGETYVDDFSTPTRAHVFSAHAVRRDGEDVIEIDYLSDLSALTWIDLSADVSIADGRGAAIESGRHRYGHSSTGSYTLTHSIRAVRKRQRVP